MSPRPHQGKSFQARCRVKDIKTRLASDHWPHWPVEKFDLAGWDWDWGVCGCTYRVWPVQPARSMRARRSRSSKLEAYTARLASQGTRPSVPVQMADKNAAAGLVSTGVGTLLGALGAPVSPVLALTGGWRLAVRSSSRSRLAAASCGYGSLGGAAVRPLFVSLELDIRGSFVFIFIFICIFHISR